LSNIHNDMLSMLYQM